MKWLVGEGLVRCTVVECSLALRRYCDWQRQTRDNSGPDIVEHDSVRTGSGSEVHVSGEAKFQT